MTHGNRLINRKDGFTLVEVLVAISLLALLSGLLVFLFQDAMEIWRSGESRRQVYETAHSVLPYLERDLNHVWVPLMDEHEPTGDPPQPREPFLFCTTTGSGETWLELIRTREGFSPPVEKEERPDLVRITYVTTENNHLYRGEFAVNNRPEHLQDPSLLQQESYRAEHMQLLSRQILKMDLRFWGPWTENGTLQDRWGSGEGPSLVWDSSREALENFRLYSEDEKAPPALPSMVRIHLDVPERSQTEWPRINTDISEGQSAEDLNDVPILLGMDLPPDGMFRMNGEWFSYADRSDNTIQITDRARRGTDPRAHEQGDEMIWGHAFRQTVRVNLYPGDSFYGSSPDADE